MDVSALRQRFGDAGQSHVFDGVDSVSDDEQTRFYDYLSSLDLDHLLRAFETSTSQADETAVIRPPPAEVITRVEDSELPGYWDAGLQLIRDSKIAALVLAGGQGTRLGYHRPKGTFRFESLPGSPSLFQIHLETLRKLEELAGAGVVHLYVMTSLATHAETMEYFEENDYFGKDPGSVHFFMQGDLPAFSLDGKLLLEAPGRLCRSPNGNGAVYKALRTTGMMDDIVERGVSYIHMYSVDNILIRVADPVFMAKCAEFQADFASKVLPKSHPHERVGVFGLKDDKYHVVEYSEISKEMAEATRPDSSELLFNQGNIVNFCFSVDFLRQCSGTDFEMYHVAKKDIATVSGPVPGIKLELFNFDICKFANRLCLLMGKREEDFSPLKNAIGSERGCTSVTCVADFSKLMVSWIRKAGGTVEDDAVCYISRLVSYSGEGLEEIVGGKEFTSPVNIIPTQ